MARMMQLATPHPLQPVTGQMQARIGLVEFEQINNALVMADGVLGEPLGMAYQYAL
jgi:hypothetical protein